MTLKNNIFYYIFSIILILEAPVFAFSSPPKIANAVPLNKSEEANRIIDPQVFLPLQTDFVYGNKEAPISVLEVFSLTCPHCSNFYASVFPDIKRDYIDTGKVFWIKRSFAMDAQSFKGTILLSCVDPEKRESYLKILLDKQSNWAYQENYQDILANIANLGGMSKKEFDSCVSDINRQKIINEENIKLKNQLKIEGTPAFYINQEKLILYSKESFIKKIEQLLKSKVDHKN